MCSILIGYKNWWSYGHPKTLGQMNRGILGTCRNQYRTGIGLETLNWYWTTQVELSQVKSSRVMNWQTHDPIDHPPPPIAPLTRTSKTPQSNANDCANGFQSRRGSIVGRSQPISDTDHAGSWIPMRWLRRSECYQRRRSRPLSAVRIPYSL